MRNVLRRAGLALGLLLTAASARAAEPAAPLTLGAKGQMTLGVERLFGFDHASVEDGPGYTKFSLAGASGLELGFQPYSVPRLALDFFVADRWSLGLGAGFSSTSPEGGSSISAILLDPRVGYAVPVSERVTFWPTFGFDFLHLSSGNTGHDLLAAALEARIVAAIAPHFGFLAAGTLDLGLNSDPQKVTELGLQCGVTGWW